MTTNATALRREIDYVSPTRKMVMGVLFLLTGLVIFFVFARSLPRGCDH